MRQTFNRTSMESKLISSSWKSCSISAFNRTSMESKHFNYSFGLRAALAFKSNQYGIETSSTDLFGIGVPFNRTSMESKRTRTDDIDALLETFNRTSMESKLEPAPTGLSIKAGF